MGKATSSVIVDNIPGGWGIRGFTSPIRQELMACGAVWNAKTVRWEVQGTKLPECVKKAIDSLSAIGASVPIQAPQIAVQKSVGEESRGVLTEQLTHWQNHDSVRIALISDEPDGTSPYMVENRLGIQPGADWLGWITCSRCGEFLDFASNRGNADAKVLVGNAGHSYCESCWADMYHLEHVHIDTPKTTPKSLARVTPLRQQYLDIKAQYKDAILFFRLGDFYETFDQDAETVAKVCDLVLTGRPISKMQRIPMAGVPHHALDRYIPQLLEKGYTVAICEQMSEPDGRGVVEREVTRVIRPQEKTAAENTIKVKTAGGTREIKAEFYGQFAIHKTVYESGVGNGWTVTHVLSGMAIMQECSDESQAIAFAEALAELDIDTWWKGDKQDKSILEKAKAIRDRIFSPNQSEIVSFKVGQFIQPKGKASYRAVVSQVKDDAIIAVSPDHSRAGNPSGEQSYKPDEIESCDYELPKRQVEFLEALANGQPLVKNAATRVALRNWGLITPEADWDEIKLTEAGRDWLALHGKVVQA